MIVVSDTSVITGLIQVEQAELLRELYGAVLIPPAVFAELLRSHSDLPTFVEMRIVANLEFVSALEAELDLGEAQAIALAVEAGADLLLIDEKLGRQIALREGLRISGLMGVLVEAKRRGLLKSVRALVGRLEREVGFRISKPVKEEAFRRSGE